MYGIKITDGDIAVRGDGNVTKTYGAERIVQDISCWILEPFNSDPLYSRFGSTVWDMVGAAMTQDQLRALKVEVTRIVNNYYEYQQRQIAQAVSNGTFNDVFPDDEVIASIEGVDVSAVADTANVTVKLRMAKGNDVIINQTL